MKTITFTKTERKQGTCTACFGYGNGKHHSNQKQGYICGHCKGTGKCVYRYTEYETITVRRWAWPIIRLFVKSLKVSRNQKL